MDTGRNIIHGDSYPHDVFSCFDKMTCGERTSVFTSQYVKRFFFLNSSFIVYLLLHIYQTTLQKINCLFLFFDKKRRETTEKRQSSSTNNGTKTKHLSREDRLATQTAHEQDTTFRKDSHPEYRTRKPEGSKIFSETIQDLYPAKSIHPYRRLYSSISDLEKWSKVRDLLQSQGI